MFEDLPEQKTIEINANTEQLRKDLAEVSAITERFGRKLSGAFLDATVKGKDLGSVLRSLALSLSKMTLDRALKPIDKLFGQALSGLTSSTITPFAKGGVLNGPAVFPMGNGMGLAGEAGPEAIMPLTRGADGRLGVASAGGSSINITFNVATNDVDSFKRSESQITALLNRAVSRGRRNL